MKSRELMDPIQEDLVVVAPSHGNIIFETYSMLINPLIKLISCSWTILDYFHFHGLSVTICYGTDLPLMDGAYILRDTVTLGLSSIYFILLIYSD